ncbi:MAG: STAS domain-containing protein [Lentisphaeria bacterium]
MADGEILVARMGAVVQVRLIGRATFKISKPLNDYCMQALNEGARQVIIEFSSCASMDSTFMGVLTMIGLDCRRRKCAIIFINTTPFLRDLLDGLGVSDLFQFTTTQVPEVNWQTLASAAGQVTNICQVADTVLEAHQALMNASPDNVPKFQSVVEMLTAEVKNLRKEGPKP